MVLTTRRDPEADGTGNLEKATLPKYIPLLVVPLLRPHNAKAQMVGSQSQQQAPHPAAPLLRRKTCDAVTRSALQAGCAT